MKKNYEKWLVEKYEENGMRIRELLSCQSIALGAEAANKKDII